MNFLTMDNSNLLSLEPPANDDISRSGDALHFQECDVINSTMKYFGDVTGEQGNSVGLTQNGSRAIDSRFLVSPPEHHIPQYTYRPNGDGYQFSWYGSYPQDWGNPAQGWVHLQGSEVHYIRDVQLGSVNISRCTFAPWINEKSPLFQPGANTTDIPPGISFYNEESMLSTTTTAQRRAPRRRSSPIVLPPHIPSLNETATTIRGDGSPVPRKTFGCNISDSTIKYIWDISILRSAVTRTIFKWSAKGVPVQESWTRTPPVNPSFWVNLDTASPQAGFPWTMTDSLACMRPAIMVHGALYGQQNVTIDNSSVTVHSRFLHMGAAGCT